MISFLSTCSLATSASLDSTVSGILAAWGVALTKEANAGKEGILYGNGKDNKNARKKEKEKGERLVCGTCGLEVTVDNLCGSVDVCDLVCCGLEMQPKE